MKETEMAKKTDISEEDEESNDSKDKSLPSTQKSNYQKAEEGYQQTKDVLYKADNARYSIQSKISDVQYAAGMLSAIISWIKNIFHL